MHAMIINIRLDRFHPCDTRERSKGYKGKRVSPFTWQTKSKQKALDFGASLESQFNRKKRDFRKTLPPDEKQSAPLRSSLCFLALAS